MTVVKWRIIVALLAALPIEALNLWVCPFPIDVGYPDGTPWYINLRGLLWVLPHLPGLRMYDLLARHGWQQYFVPAIFLSGYLSTALVLLVVILGASWIRCRRTHGSPAIESRA